MFRMETTQLNWQFYECTRKGTQKYKHYKSNANSRDFTATEDDHRAERESWKQRGVSRMSVGFMPVTEVTLSQQSASWISLSTPRKCWLLLSLRPLGAEEQKSDNYLLVLVSGCELITAKSIHAHPIGDTVLENAKYANIWAQRALRDFLKTDVFGSIVL